MPDSDPSQTFPAVSVKVGESLNGGSPSRQPCCMLKLFFVIGRVLKTERAARRSRTRIFSVRGCTHPIGLVSRVAAGARVGADRTSRASELQGRSERKKIPYASGEGLDLLGARASPEASERAATP